MDLSRRGHEQAEALAQYLRHHCFDAIYASPMKRVQQTLAPVLRNGCPKPTVMADLREVDFGDWTGLRWGEVQERYGVSAFQWLEQLECDGIANAECARVLRGRVDPCVQEVLRCHSGKHAAIFCHGGVIRMILSVLLELPFTAMGSFDIEYAGITRVALLPHKTELELLNLVPWRDLR